MSTRGKGGHRLVPTLLLLPGVTGWLLCNQPPLAPHCPGWGCRCESVRWWWHQHPTSSPFIREDLSVSKFHEVTTPFPDILLPCREPLQTFFFPTGLPPYNFNTIDTLYICLCSVYVSFVHNRVRTNSHPFGWDIALIENAEVNNKFLII